MILRLAVISIALAGAILMGQTTQGLVTGRVLDAATGKPLGGARVSYASPSTNTAGAVVVDARGRFACPLLPPGRYGIRAAGGVGHQAREAHEIDVAVAGQVDITFLLRPLADVFDAGRYRVHALARSRAEVTFFGPDVDTSRTAAVESLGAARGALETSLSQAVDPFEVSGLPFGGRDLYTVVALQPGVVSDTAAARGLGLSANGQRPTAANFRLDGLENNNHTASGPLASVAPEAMQEYRVSTNNFSAEYGGASGIIANAVTKSGGGSWHGLAYLNLRDHRLNANEFQFNAAGLPRAPLREVQPGGHVGGPLLKARLFASSAVERTSTDAFSPRPVEVVVPTPLFSRLFPLAGPVARRLMRDFPPPNATDGPNATAPITLQRPQTSRRTLALERVDWTPRQGRHRITGRLALSRSERPDHFWSPYADFTSGLRQPHTSLAATHQFNVRPGLVAEARLGWNRESLGWDRANPQIPTIVSQDGVALPGSPTSFTYAHRNSSVEAGGSLLWTRGAHLAKFGGGTLGRGMSAKIGLGAGQVEFDSFLGFVADAPFAVALPVSRQSLPTATAQSDLERHYRNRQFNLFAQDTIRATPRLVFNVGLRYDAFGSPKAVGAGNDALVEFGAGPGPVARLQGARLRFGGGDRPYTTPGVWAGRFGWSYALRRGGGTTVRMALGTFHDRPYDSLWQGVRNNSLAIARLLPDFGERIDYLVPTQTLVGRIPPQAIDASVPRLTYIEPVLRAGLSHSYLLGIRQEAGPVEVAAHALGSLSRRFVATDIINRDFSVRAGAGNFAGRFNGALPEISHLGNLGSGSYHALAAHARWRGRRGTIHAAYTWSHAIDNQSEPFDGSVLFDPGFTRDTVTVGVVRPTGSFSRQFDWRGDRGNSDFDQRHSLAVYSLAEFRGWRFGQTGAFRTGFPYSVFSVSRVPPPGQGVLYNTRATLVAAPEATGSVPGGARLLHRAAFRAPAAGAQGNTGRNAFRAPGLYSVDVSVGRSFSLPRADRFRMTLRIDLFNALNHANLGAPANQIESPAFGVATYGRQGSPSFYPALLPFQETGRQAQVLLRFEF